MGKRREIVIPLIEFESKVPVVKLNIGDRELFALVDTGSESTLFDRSLADVKGIKKKELNHDMSFVGLQGKTEDFTVAILKGTFTSGNEKVKIGGISSNLSTIGEHFKRNYNSDIIISLLLGCDFLEAYDGVIDFDEHILILYD